MRRMRRAMFALASWISVNVFGADFIIDSFWSALIGSILVSVVSFVLSALLREEAAKRQRDERCGGGRMLWLFEDSQDKEGRRTRLVNLS